MHGMHPVSTVQMHYAEVWMLPLMWGLNKRYSRYLDSIPFTTVAFILLRICHRHDGLHSLCLCSIIIITHPTLTHAKKPNVLTSSWLRRSEKILQLVQICITFSISNKDASNGANMVKLINIYVYTSRILTSPNPCPKVPSPSPLRAVTKI